MTTKNELLSYFMTTDYRNYLREKGYSEKKIDLFVADGMSQFSTDEGFRVRNISQFFFFPWFLELFPELKEILDGEN